MALPGDAATAPSRTIAIGLNAAIVAVQDDRPRVLVVPHRDEPDPRDALPFGPFDPIAHRTMEIGLRAWVADQTSLKLGYVEQLYTFGDRGRHARPGDEAPHVMSVGYLALTRLPEDAEAGTADSWRFEDCYRYFPWEDWREGRPAVLDETILPALDAWLRSPPRRREGPQGFDRRDRFGLAFGLEGGHWDEERVLDRYELLYEAGLLEEARADGREAALARPPLDPPLGRAMRFDHRRILATAMGRLRGKLKYRPVIFELMPDEFTLTELQHTAEAIAGRHVHKQNFRRFVEQAALVEETGGYRTTGGRPARLFRFRREVVRERPAPGVRVGSRF